MAKQAKKPSHKKTLPAISAKKTRLAKKPVKKPLKKSGKATKVKAPANRTAKTTSVLKHAPKQKLLAIPTKKVAKPTRPASRKPSVPIPVRPAQSVAATREPAVPVSPHAAPALQTPEVVTNRGGVMAEGLQPGQRVRHRYEHWWGTIVQRADSSGRTEAAPFPVRYVVKLDGGQNRDDIRPEDLTVS